MTRINRAAWQRIKATEALSVEETQKLFAGKLKHRRRRVNQRELSRSLRRELVHAAGCVYENCAAVLALSEVEFISEDWGEPRTRVSVPRSLRAKLGRYV